MEMKYVFMFLAAFSILLFSLVLMKRTFIAQLLGPAIPEPFAENMEMMLKPY
jgi:hypothetical protein